MSDHTGIQLALRTHLLTLNTLPAARAFENIEFVPVTGQPYIEEEYAPATTTLRGLARGGVVEATGLYVIRWYGVANTGLGALTAGVDALLALFAPGAMITTTGGDVVHIRGDVAPSRSAIRADAAGWVVCVVTVPFRVFTLNPL